MRLTCFAVQQASKKQVFESFFEKMSPRRIGIVGYGHLGKFLTAAILEHENLELAFVWNRTKAVFDESAADHLKDFILDNLEDCARTNPDLIVEVSHPVVVKKVGSN